MSDSFKTGPVVIGTVRAMTPTPSAVGLVVADLPRTLAFYRAVGLEIPSDAEASPHVELELAPGFRLLLDGPETIRSFDPSWTPPTGSPRASLAFACDSPADVDERYAQVVHAGFEGHVEPWDAFWGQRYACLLDPDGNGVDLFATLDGPA